MMEPLKSRSLFFNFQGITRVSVQYRFELWKILPSYQVNKDESAIKQGSKRKLDNDDNSSEEEEDITSQPLRPTRYNILYFLVFQTFLLKLLKLTLC